MGYRTVALSRGPAKKELALELGAHEFVDTEAVDPVAELQKMGGAAVCVAVAPSGKAISSLLPALAVEGQLLVLAVADDLTLPIGECLLLAPLRSPSLHFTLFSAISAPTCELHSSFSARFANLGFPQPP